MTRENKLALVVGFGLILFVGILISDHFSTARNQESADLRGSRAVDPLAEGRRNDPGLIDLADRARDARPTSTGSPLAVSPVQIPQQTSPPSDRETPRETRGDDVQPVIEAPERPAARRIVMGPDPRARADRPAADPRIAFHDVERGESLIAICRRYYGDASFVQELARYNGMDNPDALRADRRLRIPPIDMLRAGATPTTTTTAARNEPPDEQPRDRGATIAPPGTRPSAPPTTSRTYTVQSGDTLSEISLMTLGTSKRWREIYELNRDVIDDPDNVIVGTELEIPARGGR